MKPTALDGLGYCWIDRIARDSADLHIRRRPVWHRRDGVPDLGRGGEVVTTPANAIWSDDVAPGGYVCAECLAPVESEPCPDHGEHEADPDLYVDKWKEERR